MWSRLSISFVRWNVASAVAATSSFMVPTRGEPPACTVISRPVLLCTVMRRPLPLVYGYQATAPVYGYQPLGPGVEGYSVVPRQYGYEYPDQYPVGSGAWWKSMHQTTRDGSNSHR